MWTRTGVTEELGIDYPSCWGPSAEASPPSTWWRRCRTRGGLGGFGAVGLTPDEIRRHGAGPRRPHAPAVRHQPLGPARRSPSGARPRRRCSRASARLRPYFDELGLPPPELPAGPGQPYAQQMEALLEARPPVFSFIMGIPRRRHPRAEAHRRGIRTVGTATSVEEAVALEAAGVDVVVASGSDAGGHRGSFLAPPLDSLVGTLSLVPQVARAVAGRWWRRGASPMAPASRPRWRSAPPACRSGPRSSPRPKRPRRRRTRRGSDSPGRAPPASPARCRAGTRAGSPTTSWRRWTSTPTTSSPTPPRAR